MDKEKTLGRYRAIASLLRCPLCGKRGRVAAFGGFLCEKKHCFDLSARGYLNLIPAQNQEKQKYDRALFLSRQQVFAGGFYTPVVQALHDILRNFPQKESSTVLDVGCGEGYFLTEVAAALPEEARCIGIDLSRDAIRLAAARDVPICWLIANLKAIPLAKDSVDLLFNILTPADYSEFSRVLKRDGLLIKIVPGPAYLQEIRSLLPAVGGHDAHQTVDYFEKHVKLLDRRRIQVSYDTLTPAESEAFLRMTPLTFSASTGSLAGASLSGITIDMELLVGRRKK